MYYIYNSIIYHNIYLGNKIYCLIHTLQIAKGDFIDCYKVIKKILTQYNAESQMPHRQRLVWKLSERTLQCLRPTENLIKTLPTIREHTLSCLDNTDCEESWD